MPPTMITGINSAGPAARKLTQISRPVERVVPVSQPDDLPYQTHTTTSASAEMTAGISPATDISFIDTPATNA